MNHDYIEIVNQAMNYIYSNIDDNLTTEQIAAQCCFSQYHFNRVFKSVTGENIYSFIRRMRLERAAFRLKTQQQLSITEIALEAGYSPSNFASAFKNYFGISATTFAATNIMPKKDCFQDIANHIQTLKKDTAAFHRLDGQVKLKTFAAMTLMYKRVICHYTRDLKREWALFCTELQAQNLLSADRQLIGIGYDDPLLVDEDRCVYDMCLVLPAASGTNVRRLAGGLYAVFEFYDSLDKFVLFANEIFSLWLPYCRYELDDKPGLEIYNSGVDDCGKISISFCIPLKSDRGIDD